MPEGPLSLGDRLCFAGSMKYSGPYPLEIQECYRKREETQTAQGAEATFRRLASLVLLNSSCFFSTSSSSFSSLVPTSPFPCLLALAFMKHLLPNWHCAKTLDMFIISSD